MKRNAMINEHSWMNHRVLITLALAFMIYAILTIGFPNLLYGANNSPGSSQKADEEKTPRQIEYEVKAAFIYNFMKFIEWPVQKKKSEDEQAQPEKHMLIGILGDNPFGDAFKPVLAKEVHGRKIHLVKIPGFSSYYTSESDKSKAFEKYHATYKSAVDDCDILFICSSEKKHLKELLLLASGNWTLTVSDMPDFARNGGIIGFIKDDNKIRFEINLNRARKENIKIRSQLLTLAKTVYGGK